MAYVSEWERLDDAANRIMATGLSKDETQTDICRAVSDRAVRIRANYASTQAQTSFVLRRRYSKGKDFDIPSELKPEDLDWETSRSSETMVSSAMRRSVQWGHWELEWIELSRHGCFQRSLRQRQRRRAGPRNARRLKRAQQAEAGQHLNGQTAPPKSSMPKAYPIKPRCRTRVYAGGWLKSSRKKACLPFLMTRF